MTMNHGCHEIAVQHWDKKWNCQTTKMGKQHTIRFINMGYLYIDEMYGDCTAATLFTAELSHAEFIQAIPAITEFLSMNGRISAMFTRKVHVDEVMEVAADLQQFPIMGLHVQHSNRDTDPCYQLTGILKIPNPYVKQDYRYHQDNMAQVKHNHCDMTELIQINKEFGFEI